MENLSNNNNQEIQDNIQAEIDFLNDMDTLRMNLPRIDTKVLKGTDISIRISMTY